MFERLRQDIYSVFASFAWKANNIKSNGTYEEIMKVAEWMRKTSDSI